MKTTNGQAFDILVTLSGLAETGRLGYAIAKNRRVIETELTEFIAIRNRAIQSRAVDGVLSPEAAEEANKEISEFVNLPCDFPVYTVPLDIFVGGGLTADQMYLLDFMVEVETDAE